MPSVNPITAPTYATVPELLRRHGMRAKKSWGQNFLLDPRAYEAIVRAADVGEGDTVVEIGAGLGTVTAWLLHTGAEVVAVERERDMCAVLRAELGEHARLHLREEDALHLDVPALATTGPVVIVGNLPYQIATPLIFHFLASRAHVRRMVVMIQREVAARLLAAPDTEDYSALGAQVQMLCTVRRVTQVGRGAFLPAPRVDSTVVLLEPLPGTRHAVHDLTCYQQVVRAAFGQRRKTMRNALSSVFGKGAEVALHNAGIDPMRRGESLSLPEFARVADALSALRSELSALP